MTTATRQCRECKSRQRVETMTAINGAFYCNMDHAIAYGRRMGQKAREKAQKAEVAQYKANDTQRLHKAAQVAVNRLCKLLDQGKPCISCGRPDQGGRLRNAGHYKSRGANSAIRYDLRNLHQQCVQCNNHLSGNVVGYYEGLLKRYGVEITEYLDNAPRLKSWTAEELRQIRAEAAEECRRIEKGLLPSRNWRALPDRRAA